MKLDKHTSIVKLAIKKTQTYIIQNSNKIIEELKSIIGILLSFVCSYNASSTVPFIAKELFNPAA